MTDDGAVENNVYLDMSSARSVMQDATAEEVVNHSEVVIKVDEMEEQYEYESLNEVFMLSDEQLTGGIQTASTAIKVNNHTNIERPDTSPTDSSGTRTRRYVRKARGDSSSDAIISRASNPDVTDGGYLTVSEFNIHTNQSRESGTTSLSNTMSPPLPARRTPKGYTRQRSVSSSLVRVIDESFSESRPRRERLRSLSPRPTRFGRYFGEETSIITSKRVCVKGVNEGVDLDIVKEFFEDLIRFKASDISRCDTTNDITIEFQTVEGAQSVLEKARSEKLRLYVSNTYLTVEPCPEKDKKCLLVNGIDGSATHADIAEYLHEHCDIATDKIQSLQFGTKEGAAVIQFYSPRPDIETFRKRLSKRPFRGKMLRFEEVDQCRSIIVQHKDPSLLEADIVRYFSKTGLSSGGQIDAVQIYLPLNAYVVVFRSTEVVQRVLSQNPHTLLATTLIVEPFYSSLQASSINEITTPEPLIFNDLDRYIVRFVKNSEEYRKEMESKMATFNGKVVWPCKLNSDGRQKGEKHLKVICTIDLRKRPNKSLKTKLKNWQHNCSGKVKHFFQEFEKTRKILVADQVWKTLHQYIDTMDDPKGKYRAVFRNEDFSSLRIVGKKELTKDLYGIISSKVDELEKDFVAAQKTNCLQKFVQLSSNEMSLLRYSRALEEIEKEMPTVVIKPLDPPDGLEIMGRLDSIEQVVDKIQYSLNSYSKEVLNITKHGITGKTLDLLKTYETEAYIANLFDKKIGGKSKACYGVNIDNNVEVCATDEESLTEAIRIIRDSIKEKELKSLTLRHRAVLCGHDGDILFTSIQKKHMGLFLSYKGQDDSISFVTIRPIIEEVEEMISLCIDNHEIISEFIEVGSGRLAYLLTYKANEMENIEDEYRPKGVEIKVVEGMRSGFSINGEKQYCREIGWRLQLMIDIIVERSLELNWDGFDECLKGNQGSGVQSKISVIGLENKCVVKISPTERHRRTNVRASLIDTKLCTTIGSQGESLYLVAGDITDLEADVIVIPSYSSLELSGGIGRTVGAKGGFVIQKECCDIIKSKNGQVSPGDVFATTGGSFSVKHLLHAVTPYNDALEKDADMILASLVDQCISKASALGDKSIAFPLIGTGQFNFSLDKVAEVLLTTIMTYFKEEHDTVLERVYICDLDEEKLKNVILQFKRLSECEENDELGENSTNRRSGKSLKFDVTMEPLAELQADVFVNATTRDMNLRIGALGKAILDAAGDEVLDDIKRAYPDGVRYGEVAISNTGRMKDRVKAFFHGQIPVWGPNHGFSEIVLSKFVTECLLEANRRSYRSIAFPALGCGKRGYPPDVVVTTMLRAINEFARQNPGTTVDLVKFVVSSKDLGLFEMFNDFVSGNKNMEARSFVSENFSCSCSINDFLLQRSSQQIQIGPVSFKLTLGNITMEGTHAIVNSTNVALDLNLGLVSSMILLTAGKVIQLECNTEEKKKQAQENKIVTTGPGRLLCKKIIHLVAGENIQQWRKCVKRCLQTAEAENLPTVSFPAIGTGRCGQSAPDMANVLATTVKKYVESNEYRGILRAIRVVIFNQEMLNEFKTTTNKRLSGVQRGSWIPKFFVKNESPAIEPDVKFHIFAETKKDAERVIQELHSLKTEEKISFPSSVINRLTESQEHALQNIAKHRRTVMVDIDRTDGCIAVTGFGSGVAQTRQEIERYLAKHSNVALPDHWKMNVSDSPKQVELQKNDPDYRMAHSRCRKTLPSGTIVKIERIQNPLLYIQFEERRIICESQTKSLWYGGGSPEDASYISKHGFDRLCEKGFTKQVRTAYDEFCSQDLTGVKVLILVDVLVSDGSASDEDLFRITESNQAYPKFAVSFKQSF
ncbi:protein mono-ADP-ribosyltransferase PARP14-like [Mya arenaria]|uniref:protein mono-ADP-ribosyltransferase PARP14-like n=1 Tax=Mya arenaria TaxID=6604 RepID=UPI0022E97230|nr:protein mono-ADP-ribosyltransferase PARP14-like [Mya arenaria]